MEGGPIPPRNTSRLIKVSLQLRAMKGGGGAHSTPEHITLSVRWPNGYVWWLEVLQGPVPKQIPKQFFSMGLYSSFTHFLQCLLLGGLSSLEPLASVLVSISKKSNWIFLEPVLERELKLETFENWTQNWVPSSIYVGNQNQICGNFGW